MRIVFFGTSNFSTQIFSYLRSQGAEIVAVVTQPDKPRGRGKKFHPPHLKKYIQEHCPDIPILQPVKASNEETVEKIHRYKPDLFVVASFGQLLKQNLLDVPIIDSINVHTSLLPEYRGAAPIQRALMDGKDKTGITIMRMVLKMDAGDILAKEELLIQPNETYEELEERLAKIGGPLLVKILNKMDSKPLEGMAQKESAVTFAHKIQPEECEIDWSASIEDIHNKIRGLSTKPGAWSWITVGKEKKKIKILKSQIFSTAELKNHWFVRIRDGILALLIVQPEGKKPMLGADFLRGCRETVSFYGNSTTSSST